MMGPTAYTEQKAAVNGNSDPVPSPQSNGAAAELGMNSLISTAAQNAVDFSVPMWDLSPDDSLKGHRPGTGLENSFWLKTDTDGHPTGLKTSVIGTDERQEVNPADFAPDGKYRSVVKLSLIFKRNGADAKMMGTGWLVAPDLVVTAGHCVYDKAYRMGQVKQIVAYLGYQGVDSLMPQGRQRSNVETSYGKVVATTPGWIADLGRQYDIAWIKLNRPFQNYGKLIQWDKTPFQGKGATIGVVGYPGDKSYNGEYGAKMYECWMPTDWDLTRSKMLEYKVDTAGGQSGSPVFYSLNAANINKDTYSPYPGIKDLAATSIAVHTYGGAINAGTPLGPFGNPMIRYLAVLEKNTTKLNKEIRYVLESGATEAGLETPFVNGFDPVVKFKDGALDISVPFANEEFGFGDILNIGTKVLGSFFESAFEDDDTSDAAAVEGFLDFLAKAAKTATSVGLPMLLGPAGVPVSMVANAAITSLAKSLDKSRAGAEAEVIDDEAVKKQLYRAALADAVFDSCCKHHKVLSEEGIFDFVKKWVPIGVKVATTVSSAFGEFAEQASSDASYKVNGEGHWEEGIRWPWKPVQTTWTWDDQPVDPKGGNVKSAIAALTGNYAAEGEYAEFTKLMNSDTECWPGVNWAKIPRDAFKTSQQFLSSNVGSYQLRSGSTVLTNDMQITHTMRALTGEMLLSAIEAADPAQIQAINSEGFFSDTNQALKKILGKLGDSLVTYGPEILDAINKIVQKHISSAAVATTAGAAATTNIPSQTSKAASETTNNSDVI
ncbi:hypothetical protein TruAng_008514 [Truncatella angustata]|nr:hypothetical protein TruAng_008514 [Truncatella angustata]